MRTPTGSAASSAKKKGEWLVATFSGSWSAGVTPSMTKSVGAFRAKNEKSSEPVRSGSMAVLPLAAQRIVGSIRSVSAGSLAVTG